MLFACFHIYVMAPQHMPGQPLGNRPPFFGRQQQFPLMSVPLGAANPSSSSSSSLSVPAFANGVPSCKRLTYHSYRHWRLIFKVSILTNNVYTYTFKIYRIYVGVYIVHIHLYIHIHIHICIYTYIYMNIYTYIYMNIYTNIYMNIYIHTYNISTSFFVHLHITFVLTYLRTFHRI